MEKKRDWKEIMIHESRTVIISLFVALLAAYLFTFIIEPSMERPNLEIIFNPKSFDEGELVTFNITIENIGGATARELFFFAIEESENENPQTETKILKPSLLQTGDVTYVEFDMIAPENQQPHWIIELRITTTDRHWEFELMYDYVPGTKVYQIPKPY